MADDEIPPEAGRFGKIDIEVNGERVHAEISAELSIADLSRDMDEIAAKMAYWGAVWAEAEAERERTDAAYRFWRADFGRIFRTQVGEAKEPPEWKVAQAIESSPKFRAWKEGQALALRNATLCKAVYESFRVKASILQSKGAMARAEMDAIGMTTKTSAQQEVDRKRRETARAVVGKTAVQTDE